MGGTRMPRTALTLFSGLGGGALGLQRAGFRLVGGVEVDAQTAADYEYLTGSPCHVGDLATMTPGELRDVVGERRPDVVLLSPPCKGFSGCLPAKRAGEQHYVKLNSLAERGIWIALEAWPNAPPPLFCLENVPLIQTRGREWLDAIGKLLTAYGYAFRHTVHDCGRLGGLGQKRRRFLLVARHTGQVPEFVYEPPQRRLRGCGEVLSMLPVPIPVGPDQLVPGGELHRLGRLCFHNWLRLALVPAGGDWRDLPESVALTPRANRHSGRFGVEAWARASHTVCGSNARVGNGWASATADPRIAGATRRGVCTVHDANLPARTVIGNARAINGTAAIADLRLGHTPRRGGHGVVALEDPVGTVIGATNGAKGDALAAPLGYLKPTHHIVHDGRARWWCVGPTPDPNSRAPIHMVIRALDGSWHRPLTTLELAVLQGLPARVDGRWLTLTGGNKAAHRQRIGNAIPPPAAQAIGEAMMRTLDAAFNGTFLLAGEPVWVHPRKQTSPTLNTPQNAH